MSEALAFDMYGTLVDPVSVRNRLAGMVGDAAGTVAEQWRSKQLEYTFRLTAMGDYRDFAEVTARALDYALLATGQTIDEAGRRELLAEYQRLEPYPDTVPGLRRLAAAGHPMVVFSNGTPAMLDGLLDSTGLRDLVPDAVSVDEVGTYKPARSVYRHLTERLGRRPEEVRLVSSNPFDIVGAVAAGLRAAWCNRSGGVFDTLGDPPDVVVDTIEELADALAHARETDRG